MPVGKIVADYGGSANRAQPPGRVLEAAASPRNNRCENPLGIMRGSMGRGGGGARLAGPRWLWYNLRSRLGKSRADVAQSAEQPPCKR